MILISVRVRQPESSLSKILKISITSEYRFWLLIFYSMYSRNQWKSMVPFPSSSISFSLLSTSYSLTLSPSPLRRNFRVRLVMWPVLLRSYILKISFSSSICSTLYELNFQLLAFFYTQDSQLFMVRLLGSFLSILSQTEQLQYLNMLDKPKRLNVPALKETTQVKVALIGEQQSGKTSLVSRATTNTCPGHHEPTLGVTAVDKYVPFKNGQMHITFWDFGGRLDYIDIRNEMYKEASLIILVIDLTNKQSIDNADYWLKQVKDNGGNCPVYIVGNKTDNKKYNPDFNKAARQRDGVYIEVSCRNGEGVDTLVNKIVADFK